MDSEISKFVPEKFPGRGHALGTEIIVKHSTFHSQSFGIPRAGDSQGLGNENPCKLQHFLFPKHWDPKCWGQDAVKHINRRVQACREFVRRHLEDKFRAQLFNAKKGKWDREDLLTTVTWNMKEINRVDTAIGDAIPEE